MWKKGRRFFSAAAILMLLTALVHTAGNLASKPETAAELRIFTEMSDFRLPLGMGMNPSMQDILKDLTYIRSITFAALGFINLLLAASPETSAILLRHISWINLLWVSAFLILNWAYRIPPALVSGIVVEAAVIASLLADRPAPSKTVRT